MAVEAQNKAGFRASWPYFQLLRPSRLEKRLIFDIWALFTRKMKSETVIFAPNGLNVHF